MSSSRDNKNKIHNEGKKSIATNQMHIEWERNWKDIIFMILF